MYTVEGGAGSGERRMTVNEKLVDIVDNGLRRNLHLMNRIDELDVDNVFCIYDNADNYKEIKVIDGLNTYSEDVQEVVLYNILSYAVKIEEIDGFGIKTSGYAFTSLSQIINRIVTSIELDRYEEYQVQSNREMIETVLAEAELEMKEDNYLKEQLLTLAEIFALLVKILEDVQKAREETKIVNMFEIDLYVFLKYLQTHVDNFRAQFVK